MQDALIWRVLGIQLLSIEQFFVGYSVCTLHKLLRQILSEVLVLNHSCLSDFPGPDFAWEERPFESNESEIQPIGANQSSEPLTMNWVRKERPHNLDCAGGTVQLSDRALNFPGLVHQLIVWSAAPGLRSPLNPNFGRDHAAIRSRVLMVVKQSKPSDYKVIPSTNLLHLLPQNQVQIWNKSARFFCVDFASNYKKTLWNRGK